MREQNSKGSDVGHAFAVGDANFKECQLVHQFLNGSLRPRLENAVAGQSDAPTSYGIFLRAVAWLRSLWKLNEPADFQAAVAGCRALFEMAVDVTLMHHDPENGPPKMLAWEDSAKLKSAQKIRDYFTGMGTAPGADFEPQMQFLARNASRIEALRAQHWPGKNGKGHHPPRWTGRDLERDAGAATGFAPGGKFDEFYVARYQQLCWDTHGSALASIRLLSPSDFPALSAVAMGEAARFALIAAEMIVKHAGLWDEALAAEFKGHREQRILTKYVALQQHGIV